MKKLLTVAPLIFFLLLLSILFYLLKIERNPSEIPSSLINKNVPKFEAQSLMKNEIFTSTQEFGGEKMLVNFFATWCKPCREEHKFIKDFFEDDIKIIGINYKDDPEKTIKWIKDLGNPYSNIVLDKNGLIAIDWGVYGIPETFVVNSKGFIKYRHVGPITKKNFNKIKLLIKEIE